MRLVPLLQAGVLFAVAACGSSTGYGGSGSGAPGPNEVWAQNTAFTPATRTVTAGTIITFTNKDNFAHTVTSSSVPAGASAFTQSLGAGGTAQLTFTTPGTYQYYCTIHGTPGAGMHATIVVN